MIFSHSGWLDKDLYKNRGGLHKAASSYINKKYVFYKIVLFISILIPYDIIFKMIIL